MPRSWANAESTKYRALLAGPLFFPWACTRANVRAEIFLKTKSINNIKNDKIYNYFLISSFATSS
jgi:hypothetical protein